MLILGRASSCGTGILPVSCLLSGRHLAVELASCQCHAYSRAGRMPTLLILIRQEARGKRQEAIVSLLPIPDSQTVFYKSFQNML
ncbi:hypothetical protein [Moorena sp. SIO3H5]|uniref:hypothetical protein n=1 Tax=Moorena sp. SIO3H5 TaxID=2607834 RepID=UPI0013B80FB9|nr:hypothetical protein [Moorena sp. SIO3H5]NEO74357.1 hypothetical protein [Moorena sp. SIO3H5]